MNEGYGVRGREFRMPRYPVAELAQLVETNYADIRAYCGDVSMSFGHPVGLPLEDMYALEVPGRLVAIFVPTVGRYLVDVKNPEEADAICGIISEWFMGGRAE